MWGILEVLLILTALYFISFFIVISEKSFYFKYLRLWGNRFDSHQVKLCVLTGLYENHPNIVACPYDSKLESGKNVE